ncbi:hypothetical protein GCM10017674_07100 [Streptomyces gardneri]|uniref:Ig-like domain-containing protein n=1 Tax=Streptomyces gardneri TaxID=66892 RepID=A0A4Y3RTQ4_9ACTN|nr:hypothetical protein SGA01_66810 [Streptomyces gardneri]GHG84020.1 hypothetical protein GCM10017674_07100 [Streptomyces gardneri]
MRRLLYVLLYALLYGDTGATTPEPQTPLRLALPYSSRVTPAQPPPYPLPNRRTTTLMCEVTGLVLFGRKCEN